MAPYLEDNRRNNVNWRSGMEILCFSSDSDIAADAKSWYKQSRHDLPLILTTESLATAPDSALVIFRSACRGHLLEGMQVGNPEYISLNTAPTEIMAQLVPNRFEVGPISEEPWDQGKTTNYLVPLITDKGVVNVVYNPAWGFSWCLGEDHPLLREYPQLGKVQHEDTSTPPSDPDYRGPRYLPVEVLADVTERRTAAAGTVATYLHLFLDDLSQTQNLNIYASHMNVGRNFLGDNYYAHIGIESKGHSSSLQLGLGYERGVKQVFIDDYVPFGNKIPTTLHEQARSLKDLISSLHELPSTR